MLPFCSRVLVIAVVSVVTAAAQAPTPAGRGTSQELPINDPVASHPHRKAHITLSGFLRVKEEGVERFISGTVHLHGDRGDHPAAADATRGFSISDITPGTYHLDAQACGGDVATRILDISASSPPGPLLVDVKSPHYPFCRQCPPPDCPQIHSVANVPTFSDAAFHVGIATGYAVLQPLSTKHVFSSRDRHEGLMPLLPYAAGSIRVFRQAAVGVFVAAPAAGSHLGGGVIVGGSIWLYQRRHIPIFFGYRIRTATGDRSDRLALGVGFDHAF